MTQPTREEALAHFGVKGMRWGVRKSETSSASSEPKKRMSNKKKAAIGVGVLAVGTAVTLAVLGKHGNLPVQHISMRLPRYAYPPDVAKLLSDIDRSSSRQATDRGARTVKKLSETDAMTLKFKKLLKEFDADIADAHREETTWMLRNVPSYNPRSNPYMPESERERLRSG